VLPLRSSALFFSYLLFRFTFFVFVFVFVWQSEKLCEPVYVLAAPEPDAATTFVLHVAYSSSSTPQVPLLVVTTLTDARGEMRQSLYPDAYPESVSGIDPGPAVAVRPHGHVPCPALPPPRTLESDVFRPQQSASVGTWRIVIRKLGQLAAAKAQGTHRTHTRRTCTPHSRWCSFGRVGGAGGRGMPAEGERGECVWRWSWSCRSRHACTSTCWP